MFKAFLSMQLIWIASLEFTLNSVALERATSSYCMRPYLEAITPHEHRPHDLVRSTRVHLMREGSMYTHATREEQIAYLMNHVEGLEHEQAAFILDRVFNHAQALPNARVVFGGSRVRGNAHVGSDLDIGVYGFPNNPLNKLIKAVNERASNGSFKLFLETTKIYDGNQTATIPLIVSPEEFFLRTGTRAKTEGELKAFTPSGFISISADGTIVHVPAPKMN
jgi:predicted nucleotidyltransferase